MGRQNSLVRLLQIKQYLAEKRFIQWNKIKGRGAGRTSKYHWCPLSGNRYIRRVW